MQDYRQAWVWSRVVAENDKFCLKAKLTEVGKGRIPLFSLMNNKLKIQACSQESSLSKILTKQIVLIGIFCNQLQVGPIFGYFLLEKI